MKKQRISDLLDGLEFDGITLSANTEAPVSSIKDRTLRKVRAQGRAPKRSGLRGTMRFGHAAACIAFVLLISTFTACAASPAFRSIVFSVLTLDTTDTGELSAENTQTFSTVEGMDGISMHYIPMDMERWYEFLDGVLISTQAPYYQTITKDYTLEELRTETVDQTVEWRGRSVHLHFVYTPDQGGLPSIPLEDCDDFYGHGYTNTTADTLLMWIPSEDGDYANGDELVEVPVIYHLKTGELTDLAANIDMRELSDECSSLFPGDDFLYAISASYSNFFDRASYETGEVEHISTPEPGTGKILHQTVYWVGQSRTLYQMTDDGEWDVLVSGLSNLEWSAGNGLLTGETQDQHVAVVDLLNDTIYEFPELALGGYTALRHDSGDLIALTRSSGTFSNGLGVQQIGILSPEDHQLHLLERESHTYDSCCGWLDENRFAILCQKAGQYYLCLYEFA